MQTLAACVPPPHALKAEVWISARPAPQNAAPSSPKNHLEPPFRSAQPHCQHEARAAVGSSEVSPRWWRTGKNKKGLGAALAPPAPPLPVVGFTEGKGKGERKGGVGRAEHGDGAAQA